MESLWLARAPRIDTDEFEPDPPSGARRFDEVIVGAGITGLVAALLFARAGRRVAVLESRRIGALTTGHTTAKLTLLQGARLHRIRAMSYQAVLDAYVEANREGQAWLLRYAHEHGVAVQRRDAFSYAGTPEGVQTIEREYAAARSVGLPVQRLTDAGLPFQTYAALVLADQAQFDPMELLAALAADVRAHGGRIFEDVRVTGADASDPVRVHTNKGVVLGEHAILATGTPVLNRGLYFVKVKPTRSYATSFRSSAPLPQGMYLSVDKPGRSLRTTPGADGDYLIVGGNGHPVGRHPSPASLVADLTEWTRKYWPDAQRTHAWSAQDYETPQRVPFVGWLPRGRGRIYLATGYDKWGMTNAVQCALTLSADILGGHIPWAIALHRRVTTPQALGWAIGFNAGVAVEYLKGYARGLARRLPEDAPAEGEGIVGRFGGRPTGMSTVDGYTCRVSAVCTHMRAVLDWNDFERSWDCPAHGSRFDADGTLLQGPAVHDLVRR